MSRAPVPLLVSACLVAAFASSCTVVGYGIGTLADRQHRDPHWPSREWLKEQEGRRVRIARREGGEVMGRLGPVESYPESALVLLTPRAGASLFDAGEDSDTLRMPLASVSVVRADEVSRTGVFTGLGVLFDVMIASWALFRVPHPFHPASH